MLTFAIFVVVLGLLVFIHEFGHFIMAKRAGVRVETFSFGFGPRLFGWKRGETDYRISALPLGGYVKMTGEDPKEEAAQSPYSFTMKSVWERMKIVVAGPLMNLLLPFFLMPLVYLIGIQQPAYLDAPPIVGWVEEGSPAEKAGFHTGDRIVSIQSEPTPTWERVDILFASNPGKALSVEILREPKVVRLTITPESRETSGGYTGLLQEMPPLIDSVEPNLPAAKAGLQKGDKIIAIQGERMIHWVQMAKIIRAHPQEPLEITILRGNETFTRTMEPERENESGTGILGITHLEETTFKRYGLMHSIRSGFEDSPAL
jgi:regulator of sigma E protease